VFFSSVFNAYRVSYLWKVQNLFIIDTGVALSCMLSQWSTDAWQGAWSRHPPAAVLQHFVHLWPDARDEESQVWHEVRVFLIALY